jgi:hypothetical protein
MSTYLCECIKSEQDRATCATCEGTGYADAAARLDTLLKRDKRIRADYGSGNLVLLNLNHDGSIYISWRVYGPAGKRYAIPGGDYASIKELLQCNPELANVRGWVRAS